MSSAANWAYPTNIRFGTGRIVELPDACLSLGINRPLLVTDRGLASLPILRNAAAACAQAGLILDTFSDLKSNPIEENVLDGVAMLLAGKHDGVNCVRRWLRIGCRQTYRLYGRAVASATGF